MIIVREDPLAEGGENESHTDQHNFTENIHKEIFTNHCGDNQDFMFVNPIYAEVSPQHIKNEKPFPSIKDECLTFSEEIPITQQQLVNDTTIGAGEHEDVLEMEAVDVHIIQGSTPNEVYSHLCPIYATLEPHIPVVANGEDEMKNTGHYQCLHHR